MNQFSSHLFDEGQQSLAVVLPLNRKFTFMGKLVTAQEDGKLKAVGVQVAEIVHTCGRGEAVKSQFTAKLMTSCQLGSFSIMSRYELLRLYDADTHNLARHV